jgi:hypothetical protein
LDPLNIEVSNLEQFVNHKGHEVLEDVRHRFRANENLFTFISVFQETILSHLDSVANTSSLLYPGNNRVGPSDPSAAPQMDPALYLKATTFMI